METISLENDIVNYWLWLFSLAWAIKTCSGFLFMIFRLSAETMNLVYYEQLGKWASFLWFTATESPSTSPGAAISREKGQGAGSLKVHEVLPLTILKTLYFILFLWCNTRRRETHQRSDFSSLSVAITEHQRLGNLHREELYFGSWFCHSKGTAPHVCLFWQRPHAPGRKWENRKRFLFSQIHGGSPSGSLSLKRSLKVQLACTRVYPDRTVLTRKLHHQWNQGGARISFWQPLQRQPF